MHVLLKKARYQKMLCACDSANKGGNYYMVKNISWVDVKDNDFNCVVLDSDACDGTEKHTSHALDCSFMKVDPMNGPKAMFYSQGIDAGGGRTSLSLRVDIEKINRVAPSNTFILTTCSLHGHNLVIKSPNERGCGHW